MLQRWTLVFRGVAEVFLRLSSGGPPPAFALAGIAPGSSSSRTPSYDIKQLVNDMRTLWGVPKYRTSKPKKQTRKFSWNKLFTPTTNLVNCKSCGSTHEVHTICGTCYEKVRKTTNEIKEKMMMYNPYVGERQDKEVFVKYSDDEAPEGVTEGKRVVEMDKVRPSWFKPTFFKSS
ncbi:hypothetical protein L596_024083 [Steinernema carpocapsae]|uniref:Large ribosomal subunit protein bL32m n=1 Tax=Steinernema carpocapsae TaxID=34508 RepID=A0A4U5MFP5_STECR|nr:hypothetical protein L596_024083 [Steinernema carpocapsae]